MEPFNSTTEPVKELGSVSEINYIIEQLKDSFTGDPWFGRNATALLAEVNESNAFQKPANQHSIVELVWHMVNWREFAISRIDTSAAKDLHYFEINDWRTVDHSDKEQLPLALEQLNKTQEELIHLISSKTDSWLNGNVAERDYTYKKLLNGIIQHDIYHLGQIAYIVKMLG